jgi:hypothetical protein
MYKPLIVSTFLGFELVEVCPDFLSSLSDVLPLLKRMCHSKHLAWLMASFPHARYIISKVSAPDLPSFTQTLMFALCSSFTSMLTSQMWCIHGDKHLCCATPNVHTGTPLSILSGVIPCSQAQRTHSHIAISWRSMELVLELSDTPSYSEMWHYVVSQKYNDVWYNPATSIIKMKMAGVEMNDTSHSRRLHLYYYYHEKLNSHNRKHYLTKYWGQKNIQNCIPSE